MSAQDLGELVPRAMARDLVEPLGRRWVHVQGVAHRAAVLGDALLGPGLAEMLVMSAWLHDIGYAPRIAVTGLHPLDGAVYLRNRGDVPDQVVSLVAFHSGALIEAEERGFADQLRTFTPPPTDLLDLLTTADATTGPDGSWLHVEDRVREILNRYGQEDPVHRAISRSTPELLVAINRVEQRLADAGASPAQPI